MLGNRSILSIATAWLREYAVQTVTASAAVALGSALLSTPNNNATPTREIASIDDVSEIADEIPSNKTRAIASKTNQNSPARTKPATAEGVTPPVKKDEEEKEDAPKALPVSRTNTGGVAAPRSNSPIRNAVTSVAQAFKKLGSDFFSVGESAINAVTSAVTSSTSSSSTKAQIFSSTSATPNPSAPNAPSATLNSAALSTSTSVTITIATCDSPFILVNESTAPTSTDPTWQACSVVAGAITYTVSGDGAHNLHVWAKNAGDIVSVTSTDLTMTLDTTGPVIAVVSPNGTESWKGGSSHNITWTATDGAGILANSVDLDVSSNSGTSWTSIATSQPATGSYSWTVPAPTSINYRVRVTAKDSLNNSASDSSDANFTVDSIAPTLTLDTATGGQAIAGGSTFAVQWTAADAIALAAAPISVEVSTDSGGTWTSLASGLANSGSYNWSVPSVNSTTYRIRVTADDAAGNTISRSSASDLTIDSTAPSAPTVTLASAANTTNTAVTMTMGNCTDTAYVFVNEGAQPSAGAGGWQACSLVAAAITYTVSGEAVHSLKVWAKDASGNISATATTLTVTYDITAPTVSTVDVGSAALKDLSSSWTPQWSGLVANWKMESNWNDSIGSNNATALNGPAFSTTAKLGAKSGQFDGSDDKLDMGDPAALRFTTAFTLSAWVKPSVVSSGIIFSRWTSTNSEKGFNLQLLGSGKLRFATQTDGAADVDATCDSTNALASGSWAHIVITYDGAIQRLFINGVQECTAAQSGTLDRAVGQSMYVGGWYSTSANVNGLIDEVAAWNVGLTPTEVLTIYNRQLGIYTVGSSQQITYTASDTNFSATPMSYDYSTNGGSTWVSIAASQANASAYTWTIPGISGSILIRVTATDQAGNSTSSISPAFVVDGIAPTVAVLGPNGGESLKGGATTTVSWTASDDVGLAAGPIGIDVSTDGGTSWSSVVTGIANFGSYTWTVPAVNSTTARIRVVATDQAGNANSDISNANFTIDSTVPIVTLTSLTGGSTLTSGTAQNISWTTSDNIQLASSPISLAYSADAGSTWIDIATGIANSSPYSWTIPPMSTDALRVKVTSADAAGNTASSSSSSNSTAYGIVTALAAGAEHSCMIVNGGVRCWGKGTSGELGDNSGANGINLVQPVGLSSGVMGISSGSNHTCAVVAGGVKCWGYGGVGQIGNAAAPVLVYQPLDVTGIGAGSGATAVSAGVLHTCAIVNGGVKCWGQNGSGQLGDNSQIQRNTPVAVRNPTNTGDLTNVTAIAAGGGHTCAIAAGKVLCWGGGASGQLGNNSGADSGLPVYVRNTADTADLTGATAIASGNSHSCALIDGGVQCWGYNTSGQIGTGSMGSPAYYTANSVTGMTSDVQSIMLGKQHSCGIKNGVAYCWGANDSGEIGTTVGAPAYYSNATPVMGLTSGAQAMFSGSASWHSFIITNGTIKAFGWNNQGQVGDRTTTDRFGATQVVGFNALGFQAVSNGTYNTCAIMKGGVKCVGVGSSGENGDGLGNLIDASFVDVSGLGDGTGAQAVSVGSEFACAIVNAGVKCWGIAGRLGDGTGSGSNVPVSVTGLTSGVSAISLGLSHGCAIQNGAAKCWGVGTSGQLGNSLSNSQISPVSVTGLSSGVQSIVAGRDHSCALVEGVMKCWGAGASGQLGQGAFSSTNAPVDVVSLGGNPSQISVSEATSCAIVNGSVKCWGAGNTDMLGNIHGSANINYPTDVATSVSSGVSAIRVASYNVCALVNGASLCWGSNAANEFGCGISGGNSQLPFATSSMTNVQYFQTNGPGQSHCAFSGNGVKCWGWNAYNQLGNASSGSNVPTQMIWP